VSQENEQSGLRELLIGGSHAGPEDEVLEYVAHRLKEGAHLKNVLEEEYVRRNTTQTQRNEILTDPRLVREDREGLEEYFDSEGLNPKHSSVEAQGQSEEGDRLGQSFPKPPESTPSQQRVGRSPS
jgi:hypothetical protein